MVHHSGFFSFVDFFGQFFGHFSFNFDFIGFFFPDFYVVVFLVPEFEGGAVDLYNAVFDEGFGSDEFIVGRVVDDIYYFSFFRNLL